jgi:TrmH family RNA methyltransferase
MLNAILVRTVLCSLFVSAAPAQQPKAGELVLTSPSGEIKPAPATKIPDDAAMLVLRSPILAEIADWVSQNFDIPASASLPNIEIASPERFATVMYRRLVEGQQNGAISELRDQPPSNQFSDVVAFYENASQTVPGNVGTMLRSALGLGASAVVALPGTAELHNPKTLRAAMGAPFRLPCLATDEATLAAWLSAHRIGLWLGAMDGDPVMGRGDAGPLAIAVGNEGAGVSDSLRARADRRVGIPLAPQAESLNVAVAAAILLWEVTRGG